MERNGTAVLPGAADGHREAARASGSAWAALLVVWVVWGSTFVAIRVGVESIPPLAMASLRYLVAGTMLFPVACRGGGQRLRAADRPGAAQWLGMAVVGTMLLAFGNGAACYAEQTLSAGFTALLIATVPIWMVVADGVVNRRSISLLGWLAVGIGVAGVAILARPQGRESLLPLLIVLGGSLSWGTGSVLAGRLPGPARPLLGSAMEMLAGGVVLAGLAACAAVPDRPGLIAGNDLLRHRAAQPADGDRVHLCLREPGGRSRPRLVASWRAFHAHHDARRRGRARLGGALADLPVSPGGVTGRRAPLQRGELVQQGAIAPQSVAQAFGVHAVAVPIAAQPRLPLLRARHDRGYHLGHHVGGAGDGAAGIIHERGLDGRPALVQLPRVAHHRAALRQVAVHRHP